MTNLVICSECHYPRNVDASPDCDNPACLANPHLTATAKATILANREMAEREDKERRQRLRNLARSLGLDED